MVLMANFEKKYYEQSAFWDKDFLSITSEHDRIFATVAIIPSDVQTMLDVGCGNGAFLNSLPNTYEATGLDSSTEALKHVKAKRVHADMAVLPFQSERFDLVTCLEVLEHLPFDILERALSELQRVSKKYIIISVPNDENLDRNLVICPACRCWYNPCHHVRSFDPEKLKTLFDRFALSELKEIGSLEPRPRHNRYLYAAYHLWRNTPPPSTAVCPQCGYQPTDSPLSLSNIRLNGLSSISSRLLKFAAKVIWRLRRHSRWLLALYFKKNLEE
jgi:ubiquinone/menaquinone biosynthesis C-methylase UbiE